MLFTSAVKRYLNKLKIQITIAVKSVGVLSNLFYQIQEHESHNL